MVVPPKPHTHLLMPTVPLPLHKAPPGLSCPLCSADAIGQAHAINLGARRCLFGFIAA